MSAERLAAAADQLEIVAIVTRYGHALDRRDRVLLETCFHPDSSHRHGPFTGSSADFIGFAMDFLNAIGPTHHHLAAPHIRLEGDVAQVETYFVAYHRIPETTPFDGAFAGVGAPQDLFIGGRYVDRFARRAGVWKIASRIGVHDWQRLTPAADAGFFETPAEQRGAYGEADPAWTVPRR
jgi:hypothetical protein